VYQTITRLDSTARAARSRGNFDVRHLSSPSRPNPARAQPPTNSNSPRCCARGSADLISPVGAIVNGLEVMDDNPSPEDREFALDLIRKSARNASARLQFCRLAFGAAGSAGAQIDLGDAETMARGHLEDGKTKLTWTLPRLLLAKNRVKLLLNMLVIVQQSIPRGGVLSVDPLGRATPWGFASPPAAPTRGCRKRPPTCWRRNSRARSTPMRYSPTTRACWRNRAV